MRDISEFSSCNGITEGFTMEELSPPKPRPKTRS